VVGEAANAISGERAAVARPIMALAFWGVARRRSTASPSPLDFNRTEVNVLLSKS